MRAYRRSLEQIGTTLNSPADDLPPEYWKNFEARVASRLTAEPDTRNATDGLWERWSVLIDLRPRRYATALAGAVAILLCAVVVWKWTRATQGEPARAHVAAEQIVQPASASDLQVNRMNQYFRKSRLLLVGLSNMEPGDAYPVDLTAERNLSRALVRETRSLRSVALDARSVRLMGDMERIFIELANTDDHDRALTIDLIRTGIRRENLLFKVRMAESMYDSSMIACLRAQQQEQP